MFMKVSAENCGAMLDQAPEAYSVTCQWLSSNKKYIDQYFM